MARLAWIEDDIDALLDLRRLLEARYEVHEFRTYEAALAGMQEIKECDLIILDLILPSKDDTHRKKYLGLELARHMRHDAGITAPILVHSVLANEASVLPEEMTIELKLAKLDKFSRLKTVQSEIERLLAASQSSAS